MVLVWVWIVGAAAQQSTQTYCPFSARSILFTIQSFFFNGPVEPSPQPPLQTGTPLKTAEVFEDIMQVTCMDCYWVLAGVVEQYTSSSQKKGVFPNVRVSGLVSG